MVKHWLVVLRWWGNVLLVTLAIGACGPPRHTGLEPLPDRKFIPPEYIEPQTVESTWRFETIFSPHRFQMSGQDWLAIDSKGRPALAYGGSQLIYAWFDGITWQTEVIDARPGAGKYAHLLFDVKDQPHIVYATGGSMDLSLDTMYRDEQGWHRQTIDTDFYYGFSLDVILDYQGNPVVAYDANPRDSGVDSYDIQVRVAYQSEDRWQILTASEHGAGPSLVIDQQTRLHLGYFDIGRYAMVDTLYQPDGTWQKNSSWDIEEFPSPQLSNLLIDADLQPHFIYCSLKETSADWGCMLYHAWLTENGWQTEQIGFPGRVGVPSSAVMDSAGRIYLLGGKDHPILLRRDADGWQELQTLDKEGGYYPGLSLLLDRDEQVHAAYFKLPDYTLHYISEQDGAWQNQVVDQGSEPYWSATSAMAYDRRGQLHIADYDARHYVHYRSESPSGWQDEVVAPIRYLTNPESIELVFDLEDNPHIFYKSSTLQTDGKSFPWRHAFQVDGMWISEEVPFDAEDAAEFGRSLVTTDSQGRPAFLEGGYGISALWYRTQAPDIWNVQPLEDIQAHDVPQPQIAFPPGAPSTSAGTDESRPGIFYFDRRANALLFSLPGQRHHLVVPILSQSDQPEGIAMRQISPDTTIFLVRAGMHFRYATYQKANWQVYELNDLYTPVLADRLISLDGTVHLAYLDYKYREPPLYYMKGQGSTWRKTLVNGYTASSSEVILSGMALDQNGEFCLLLTDLRANSLSLGCLERMDGFTSPR